MKFLWVYKLYEVCTTETSCFLKLGCLALHSPINFLTRETWEGMPVQYAHYSLLLIVLISWVLKREFRGSNFFFPSWRVLVIYVTNFTNLWVLLHGCVLRIHILLRRLQERWQDLWRRKLRAELVQLLWILYSWTVAHALHSYCLNSQTSSYIATVSTPKHLLTIL